MSDVDDNSSDGSYKSSFSNNSSSYVTSRAASSSPESFHIKSSSPSKTKYIDKNILLDSDDSDEILELENESSSSDDNSTSSVSPELGFIEFNKFKHFDASDDENDKYRTEISHTQEIYIKIRHCHWIIPHFKSCPLNTEGYIHSKIYSAGVFNDFEWFFRIEKFKQEQDVYYGVYVNLLNYDETEAKVIFRSYLVRDIFEKEKRRLSYSKHFPQKEGFKFLGYLEKSNKNWCNYSLPNDKLTINFKVYIKLKKFKCQLVDNLKTFWKNKKFTDFTINVKGQEFPVHKAILASRSSVFAELFEKDSLLAHLQDDQFEPEVMEVLIRYIYTGRMKKLTKFPKELFIAADKYKLEELKLVCKKVMDSYSESL